MGTYKISDTIIIKSSELEHTYIHTYIYTHKLLFMWVSSRKTAAAAAVVVVVVIVVVVVVVK